LVHTGVSPKSKSLEAGGMAQMMECLPVNVRPAVQTPMPPKKKVNLLKR
jgi:hypothetical protein